MSHAMTETLEKRTLLSLLPGVGLPARYFNNFDLTGTNVVRLDLQPALASTSGTDAPAPTIEPTSFSVRWEGQIESLEAGTYTFQTTSDDGVKLWIAEAGANYGTPLISDWTAHLQHDATGTITLQANTKYKIKLEYYNITGQYKIQLNWMRPGQSSFAQVPQSQLFNPAEMLTDPSLETRTYWRGFGWSGGGVSAIASTTHHGTGTYSAQVTGVLPSGSGAYYLQDVALTDRREHEFSVWLRSATGSPVTVRVGLRKAGADFNWFAAKTVTLDGNWQKVTTRGGLRANETSVPTFAVIAFETPGTILVDDASLTDVTESVYAAPLANTGVIPPTLFGMHYNQFPGAFYPNGVMPNYVNYGTYRMWDTGTQWNHIQPTNAPINWTSGNAQRMAYLVDRARATTPNVKIIYTMGQTPSWAAEIPQQPPTDMQAWRNYVTAVGTKFKGKIQYWEIWNESDAGFYRGTPEQLKEMTQIAYEVLKAIDPTNMILSPNITGSGKWLLDWFLRAGGGNYIDIVSFHGYLLGKTPEDMLSSIDSVRFVMADHGIADRPLWDTEGANLDPNYVPTAAEARGAIARDFITYWAAGVSNFNWYTWDIHKDGRFNLTDSTMHALTPAGVAYKQTVAWLVGARMTSKTFQQDGTWIIGLVQPDGTPGHLVWNVNGSADFTLPSEWGATRRRNLDGSVAAVGAGPLQIGVEPVLLDNQLIPLAGLTATVISSSRVDLAWTNNVPANPVTLQRATDPNFSQNLLSVALPAGATSYSDTTASSLTTYYYRVGVTIGSTATYTNTAIVGIPGTMISGTVYNDRLGNALRDGQDEGLAGRTVYIDVDGNGSYNLLNTRTYTSTTNQRVLDFATVNSTIAVSGIASTLAGVKVAVNIKHTYLTDVSLSLISPSGTVIRLAANNGGNTRDFGTYTGAAGAYTPVIYTLFDDSAATSVASGAGPYTTGAANGLAPYKPVDALSALAGQTPNGNWTLQMSDASYGGDGYLIGWQLFLVAGADIAATTDSNGNYTFPDLPVGTYSVREAAPAGWSITAPSTGGYTITLGSGQTATGVDFGSYSPSAAPTSLLLQLASDTGTSGDNRTRLNNSDATKALLFDVAGTVPGATVYLYADSSLIGTAIATGTTTTVITDGIAILPDDIINIQARQLEPGKSFSSATADLPITIDTMAPTALTSIVNDGAAQRSMVTSITYGFAEPLSFQNGAFTLTRRSDGLTVNVDATPSADGKTLVLTFGGSSVIAASLADGVYDLTLDTSKIRDIAGNRLSPAEALVLHRLYGDVDGDRDVDNVDLFQFKRSLNKPAYYCWWLDYNNSGTIDNTDYFQLLGRLNKTVLQPY